MKCKSLLTALVVVSLASSFSLAYAQDAPAGKKHKAASEDVVQLKRVIALIKAKEFQEAERILKSLAKKEEALQNPDKKFLASVYKHLAKIYQLLSDDINHSIAIEKANAYQINQIPSLANAAYRMVLIAQFTNNQGSYARSEVLLKKALELLDKEPKSVIARNVRPLALALLANSLDGQNKIEEEVKVYEKLVAAFNSSKKTKRQDTINATSVLGSLYLSLGKYKEAAQAFETVHKFYENTQLKYSQEANIALEDLIEAHLLANQSDKAIEYAKLYAKRQETNINPHRKIGSLSLLAAAYLDNKNYEAVQEQIDKMDEIEKQHFGPFHSADEAILKNKFNLSLAQKNKTQADQLKLKLVSLLAYTQSKNSPYYINTLLALGKRYSRYGYYRDAAKCFREALNLPLVKAGQQPALTLKLKKHYIKTLRKLADLNQNKASMQLIANQNQFNIQKLSKQAATDFGVASTLKKAFLVTRSSTKGSDPPLLKPGDIIAYINGSSPGNLKALKKIFDKNLANNKPIFLYVIRDGEAITVDLPGKNNDKKAS